MGIEPSIAELPRRQLTGREQLPLVAHVIHRLQAGGMENGLVNLINSLSPDRYRHAIVCLTESSEFQNRISSKDVDVLQLRKREGKDPGFYLRFWQTMRKLKPAIVHTRNLGTLDLTVLALLSGVPVRIHGEHGWDISDPDGSSRKYRRLRRMCDLAVSEYVAVSKNIDVWLKDSIGIKAAKVRHLYNGVDTQLFHPDGEKAVLPFDQQGDHSLTVGVVGRMDPIKNHVWLVESIAALLLEKPEARQGLRLVVVGEGSQRPKIEDAIRSSGLSDVVRLLGACGEMPTIMRSMDVFIQPSINEGISNTILEAMASALPVIASNVGGNPELVKDGITGRLVSPHDPRGLIDALEDYIDQPKLRDAHGRKGRERAVSRFSLQTMVAEYDNLYQRQLTVQRRERVH